MLRNILVLLLLIAPNLLKAQSALTGNIFDYNNRSTQLEGATVKNLNSKVLTLTDKDGHFAI